MKKFNVASLSPESLALSEKSSRTLKVSPVLEGGNSGFMKEFGRHVADPRNFDVVHYRKNDEIYFPVLGKAYPRTDIPASIRKDVADALNLIYAKCPMPNGKFIEAEFVAE